MHPSASIAKGLVVENVPPYRLIRIGERVVAHYPLGSEVEERVILLRMVEQKWITAVELAAHWGCHRNTLGNWAWRYRFFGLDGLAPGRLPDRRETMERILRVAAGLVRDRGRRLSGAALGRAVEAEGLGKLPATTLSHLRLVLAIPEEQVLALGDEPREPEAGDTAEGKKAGGGSGETEGTGAAATTVEGTVTSGAETEVVGAGEADGADAPEVQAAAAVEPVTPVAPALIPEVLPPPAASTDIRMQHAGLSLALPPLQGLLEPLQGYLEGHWGDRPWRYRPRAPAKSLEGS